MPHEFDGEKYKETSTHQKEWGNTLISEISLSGSEHILDLGCGDGVLTALLAEKVPNGCVIGIDSSQGMIDTARRSCADNLRFQLKDMNDIGYDNEFDLIFSNATLHWIHNHINLLANCHSALKRGGVVRFNFAADGNCSNLNEVLKMTMEENAFRGFFLGFEWPWYMPKLEDYEILMQRCSFVEVKVWGENRDRFFPNAEAMTGWIDHMSIVPFLKVIADENKKTEFRNMVIDRIIERTKQENGTYFETFRRINVHAEES